MGLPDYHRDYGFNENRELRLHLSCLPKQMSSLHSYSDVVMAMKSKLLTVLHLLHQIDFPTQNTFLLEYSMCSYNSIQPPSQRRINFLIALLFYQTFPNMSPLSPASFHSACWALTPPRQAGPRRSRRRRARQAPQAPQARAQVLIHSLCQGPLD